MSQKKMMPPWEAFPTYERYTIGWRMGSGEQYLHDWYDFLKTIPANFESRLAYLKHHRPAPLNWGNMVYHTLYPNSQQKYDADCKSHIQNFLKLEIVEYDAAYQTWHNKQQKLVWPWTFSFFDTPEKAARYITREFWFFSRQLQSQRTSEFVITEDIPSNWQDVRHEIQTGAVINIDPSKGLLTLAKMLCAGSVVPPWKLGLSLENFEDDFDMDMGYVDAFRLWIMCCFDDESLLSQVLKNSDINDEWQEWITEQYDFEV